MGDITYKNGDEMWSELEEPHVARRRAIAKAHPEVKKLFGHCPKTKYMVLMQVGVHIATAIWLATNEHSWLTFVAISYVIGATMTHWLFLAIHEISHDLAMPTKLGNTLLGMFANLPIIMPYSVVFKSYHLAHHANQGTEGIDTDVPTAREANFFRGTFLKTIWVFCQIFFYALRPMFIKQLPPNRWMLLNWMTQFSFDYFIYINFGMTPFYYWGLSAVFAGSIHPVAGHFISEHYVFHEPQETYSYYGPLNVLAFNVGYHNEHHDFLNIPGSRLPELRKLAPEFYDNLHETKSWPGTIIDFVLDPKMNGNRRIRR